MKENTLSKIDLPKWQEENGKDSYLCRNNTGGYAPKSGGWINYGIGLFKKIKGVWKILGGADYIGWTSKTLCEILSEEGCLINTCCDSCPYKNKKIAIFTSREYKTKNVDETEYQKEWGQKVVDAGGIHVVVKEHKCQTQKK